MNKKKLLVYLVPFLLITSVASGASMFLVQVEQPVTYNSDQLSISYATSEDSTNPAYESVTLSDTQQVSEADFSAQGFQHQYHQYIKVSYPDSYDKKIVFNFSEPAEFDNQMGFTIIEGKKGYNETTVSVDSWGTIEHSETLQASGDTIEFTVVYTIKSTVPSTSGPVNTDITTESL